MKDENKTDTNQLEGRDDKGRFTQGNKPKAGFDKHPENRSDGRWKKEDSISYQYNKMIRMNVLEFKTWEKDNPEDDRTVAQSLAYSAVVKARAELNYLKEVTDRTEGRAQQRITHDGNMNMDITRIADEIEKVITEDDNPEEN